MNDSHILAGDALLRLKDIIGDPTAHPPIKGLIPIRKSSWWAGVKTGRYPKPVRLGPNTTAWRARDIKAFLDGLELSQ